MTLLTNKHFIAALLIAPILGVITYFAVDNVVSPDPVEAQAGDSYPLVARSNCRYESGQCTLINGDFRIDIRQQNQPGEVLLLIESELPIQGARFALVDADGNMLQSGVTEDGSWQLDPLKLNGISQLQIAIRSQDVLYYVETQTSFIRGITG